MSKHKRHTKLQIAMTREAFCYTEQTGCQKCKTTVLVTFLLLSLFWVYGFGEIRAHHHPCREARQPTRMDGGWIWNWEPASLFISRKVECTRNSMCFFEASQPCAQWRTSSSKATHPKLTHFANWGQSTQIPKYHGGAHL